MTLFHRFGWGKWALAFGLVVLTASASLACTSVFVGKNASATGNPIIARLEDGASAVSKYLVVTQAQPVKKGQTETFFNGLIWGYPEGMKKTYKYFSLPDFCYKDHSPNSWDSGHWPYSAAGINEKGVAITATETEQRSPQSQKVDPATPNGVEECMIVSLVLPRASTAREGVRILGKAVEKYGSAKDPYSEEGNGEIAGLAIADRHEIWYFEFAGHQWAAVRVPDDGYIINGNESCIQHFDVRDALGAQKNFMASRNVFAFAVRNHLPGTEKADPSDFDFALAYGDVSQKNMAAYSGGRFWLGQRSFTPSVKQQPGLGRYPFIMKPDKPITKEAIIAFFRSDEYPTDVGFDFKGFRPVGKSSNMEGHIIELGEKEGVPVEIGDVMWLALGPAMDSVYMPFHAGLSKSPKGFEIGTDVYDTQSASWAFRSVSALARQKRDYQLKLRAYWDGTEKKLFADELQVSQKALTLWKQGKKEKALEALTEHDVSVAEATVQRARMLEGQLITALAQDEEGKFEPQKAEK